jgi:hypothetical protein
MLRHAASRVGARLLELGLRLGDLLAHKRQLRLHFGAGAGLAELGHQLVLHLQVPRLLLQLRVAVAKQALQLRLGRLQLLLQRRDGVRQRVGVAHHRSALLLHHLRKQA